MRKKNPIGKVLLEKKAIDSRALSQALEHQSTNGGRLASNLLEMGLAAEDDVLLALSDQLGLPAVDLSRTIIPLAALDVVPADVAQQTGILPLRVESDRILLAMANPQDDQTKDEVQFVTGKRVEPYVAVEARLRNVIKQCYALRQRGQEKRFFFGERAVFPDDQENEQGYVAMFSSSVPEPDIEVETEQVMASIEIAVDERDPADESGEVVTTPVILVVDDEPDIVRLLQKALVAEGFQVVTAGRGLEALQAVKRHAPALVVLDAMLPEIHGFEICRKIKSSRKFSHIPVIMISAVYRGWRYAEDVKAAYGADDYFEKPFRLVPLIRRVRELLNAGPGHVDNDSNPQAAGDAYRRGVGLYKAGHHDEAEAALREALLLDPFSANIHYALANVMLAKQNVYEAIKEYEQTIELKPNLFAPLRNLAVLYQKKGFRHRAVEMWERALVCSPDEKTRQEVRQQLLKLL